MWQLWLQKNVVTNFYYVSGGLASEPPMSRAIIMSLRQVATPDLSLQPSSSCRPAFRDVWVISVSSPPSYRESHWSGSEGVKSCYGKKQHKADLKSLGSEGKGEAPTGQVVQTHIC